MNIELLKHSFLTEYSDYKNDLDNYQNYLESHENGASFHKIYTHNGMTVKGIIDSLDYYVSIGQIKKKKPARKYTTAVSQWYEYLFKNSEVENKSLQEALRAPSNLNESYIKQCTQFIDNCEQLKDKETYPALTDLQVDILINWCNDSINAFLANENKELAYKRMVAALCMKLMLFVGIPYRVARNIKFNAYSDVECSLVINGFKIRLPLGLARDFREYKTICIKKGFNVDECFLFTDSCGNQRGKNTTDSNIPTYLDSLLGINSINSVVKFGVQQLILENISDSVIIRFTGVRKEILDDCANPEDDNNGKVYSYLNSRILNSNIYSKL